MAPPGNSGALIAAASRLAMPSNIAFTGARTACSSGVAACSDEVVRPVVIAPATNKTKCNRRKMFMGSDSNSGQGSAVQIHSVQTQDAEEHWLFPGGHSLRYRYGGVDARINDGYSLRSRRLKNVHLFGRAGVGIERAPI